MALVDRRGVLGGLAAVGIVALGFNVVTSTEAQAEQNDKSEPKIEQVSLHKAQSFSTLKDISLAGRGKVVYIWLDETQLSDSYLESVEEFTKTAQKEFGFDIRWATGKRGSMPVQLIVGGGAGPEYPMNKLGTAITHSSAYYKKYFVPQQVSQADLEKK